MFTYPTADQIERTMEITGFGYLQARNHLIGQRTLHSINERQHAERMRAALDSLVEARRAAALRRVARTALTLADAAMQPDAGQHPTTLVMLADALPGLVQGAFK